LSARENRLVQVSAPQTSPPRRSGGRRPLPFEVFEPKLRIPVLRSGTVSRPGLVNRLRANSALPVVTVVAPAGYGKTTLLAQWAARDSRPFAWISLDEHDDDPIVLLRDFAAAMHSTRPLDKWVLDALVAPDPSIWASALPHLGSALSASVEAVVIVVDNAHRLRSRESCEVLMALADHLPAGSALVLAGRATPAVPIAGLRTGGRLFEIGVDELALTPREGQLLLQATGAELTLGEATELVRHCEGWPAGLYLAALALREDSSTAGTGGPPERGDPDRHLADYLREQYISRLGPSALRFLRRTSVLDRMCGALCDAVLRDHGSVLELAKIERSNLFLVPLDRQRVWYRYHHLFQDLLRRELAEHDPGLEPVLHRRAAAWYEAHGDHEDALEHAQAAGDIAHVARIVTTVALPAYAEGRAATVDRWLARFDDAKVLERYPELALQGSLIHALRGRIDDADRWLTSGEAGRNKQKRAAGSLSPQPWIAAVRATMGTNGVNQMIADAESALGGLPYDSRFRPSALVALGTGLALFGQTDRADAIFTIATSEAERLGATDMQIAAMGERSLLAAARGDQTAAEALAREALELAERSHLVGYATSSIALAAAARAALRQCRWDDARALLDKVAKVRSDLPQRFLPWLVLQTLIEEARAYLALRDVGSAGPLIVELRELLRDRPDAGILGEHLEALERELEEMPPRDDEPKTGLTAAELRLLPFLATHLSFREIGDALFVSRNTVKTQAISVYRKLGVSSRSEAIARAAEVGLFDVVA
jgi:LuxR family maltose regulon positive regulatory protein